MPKKYDIQTIENAINLLRNSKPVKKKEKTKFNKSETIEKIIPTIRKMQERGFCLEEIARKFSECGINFRTKDVEQALKLEQELIKID